MPGPRDADHVADELHQLLTQVGVTGPVVLMGHSIGGIYLRDYATRFPQNIDGLVFVDSATPFQDRDPAMKGGRSGPPSWLVSVAMKVGLPRLIGMCTEGAENAGDRIRKLQAEANCRLHSSVMFAEVGSSNSPANRLSIRDLTAQFRFWSSLTILQKCPHFTRRRTLIGRRLGAGCRKTSKSYPHVAEESWPKVARMTLCLTAQT